MNIQTNDIGHVIQLAIAPVFLLTGVATKLTVLMNRLARIIDRTRDLKIELRKGGRNEQNRSKYKQQNLLHSLVSVRRRGRCARPRCPAGS